MKNFNEFIAETKKEQDNMVYVVQFGDGTMFNFFYTEEEANIICKQLNAEVESNNAKVIKTPLSEIIKK